MYTSTRQSINTLREIARVSVSPKTIEEAEKPLGQKEKSRLIQQRVVDLIKSKPYGTKITLREVVQELGWKSKNPSGADSLMKRLIKKGVISRHPINPMAPKVGYFYTVDSPVHVIKASKSDETLETIKATKPKPQPIGALKELAAKLEPTAEPVAVQTDASLDVARVTAPGQSIKQQAMQFAWAYPEAHNDLREFIKWLDSQN